MINGFIARNWKLRLVGHPSEESYNLDNNGILAVADGVTRDPAPYLQKGLLGKLQFALKYPNPSPAKIVADLFCETFPKVLRDYNLSNRDEKAVRGAFIEANDEINYWNKQNILNVDYVMNDYAGCVASGIVEQNGVIYWGFLTDCGVAIFDEEGGLRFRTENEGPHKVGKYIWQDQLIKDKTWNQPEVRARIRSYYRNNPNEEYSFGVLTGQPEAINYVRTGVQEIRSNDYLVIYSDGLEQIIFSDSFSCKLRERDTKGLERLCKKNVETEGTLVLKNN